MGEHYQNILAMPDWLRIQLRKNTQLGGISMSSEASQPVSTTQNQMLVAGALRTLGFEEVKPERLAPGSPIVFHLHHDAARDLAHKNIKVGSGGQITIE